MRELGVQMIAAYSPQARGRSERNFSTWQGQLPQELRLRGIRTLEGANEVLSEQYISEFNRKFQVPAAQRGTAFLPCPRRNMDLIFSQRFERTVDKDNTVGFHNLVMQIEPAEWRSTMAGCKVIIHQHLGANLTLTIGGHRVGHYNAEGKLLTPLTKKQAKPWRRRVVEKSKSRLSHHTCKSRTQRGIRTFPPPLRQLTYETGHFICYEKRTFLLANDTSPLSCTNPGGNIAA
jgi:hypothetical protein